MFRGDGVRHVLVVVMCIFIGTDMAMIVAMVLSETLSLPVGLTSAVSVTVAVFVVAA